MTDTFADGLPEVLKSIKTKPLLTLRLIVKGPITIGATPASFQRLGVVTGGSFVGERLSGEVLDGGGDWQTVRADGVTTLNVRLLLKTTDGALIKLAYKGVRHGPPEIVAQLERGEDIPPGSLYFRITGAFETASTPYDWINRLLVVGTGHRFPTGPIYSLFELL